LSMQICHFKLVIAANNGQFSMTNFQ